MVSKVEHVGTSKLGNRFDVTFSDAIHVFGTDTTVGVCYGKTITVVFEI